MRCSVRASPDRSKVQRISTVELGKSATIIGTVRKVVKRQARNRRAIVHVTVEDGSGALDLTFFNQPWLANVYREGHEVAVSGIAQLYKGRLQLANQEVELLGHRRELGHMIAMHECALAAIGADVGDLGGATGAGIGEADFIAQGGLVTAD